MSLDDLQRALAEARERAEATAKRLSRGGVDAEAAFAAAVDQEAAAERALAAAQGDEYAVPLELGVRWSSGAPMTHLLSSGLRSFVTFYLEDDPSDDVEPVALAELVGSVAVKLGPPNDEVLHGHPLYERGLEGYGAYVVENSRWLEEIVDLNRIHEDFDPRSWEDARHFLLVFHDETVDAIARDIVVQRVGTSMRALLAEAVEKLWPEAPAARPGEQT